MWAGPVLHKERLSSYPPRPPRALDTQPLDPQPPRPTTTTKYVFIPL